MLRQLMIFFESQWFPSTYSMSASWHKNKVSEARDDLLARTDPNRPAQLHVPLAFLPLAVEDRPREEDAEWELLSTMAQLGHFAAQIFGFRQSPWKKKKIYQLFFRMEKRFFGQGRIDLPQPCSFLLEACTWKPTGYILQEGKVVYPEGSPYDSFTESRHGFIAEWDIRIVGCFNVNSIRNFHGSTGECTCFPIRLMSAFE